MAPRRCPERPTRWRKVARLRGEAIWQTMSIGPMSMPSSRDAVATRARSSPARSRDSTRLRRSRERLPWWAITESSPRRAASRWAMRSDIRRVLTKTRVVRCAVTWVAMRPTMSSSCSRLATAPSSSSGSSIAMSSGRRWPVSTMAQRGRPEASSRSGPAPTSSRAMVSMGRWVAERPTRTGGSRAEALQALQGEGQVGSALVPGHGVDLVDDDGAHLAERGAAARRGHQQVEGLRGGDQEVGRAPEPSPPAPRAGCPRCGPRPAAPVPGCPARRPPRRSPAAAPRGSGGRRRPAPSAGRRRRPG